MMIARQEPAASYGAGFHAWRPLGAVREERRTRDYDFCSDRSLKGSKHGILPDRRISETTERRIV